MRIFLLLLSINLFYACQPSPERAGDPLRLNHYQVIGSHNSYKEAIEPALMQLLMKEDSVRFLALDYQHLSLSEQLDHGLRKLELDVVHDPKGGRFANPRGLRLLKQQGDTPLPYDGDQKMQQAGFKVLHVQDIDFRSTCLTLTDCLREIKNWSDAHPRHLPIAISFNAKTDVIDKPGFVAPLPFTPAAFDSLDAAILAVIPKARIITPQEVRGEFPTLVEAVKAHNWPLIEEARGKFLFVLDERGTKQENYLLDHPNLTGRIMFVNADPGRPEAAFIILNDPVRFHDSIQALVRSGYLVRTRADANTQEARKGDLHRFQRALSSGAHFISTDYYLPDQRLQTGYQVKFAENTIARCNPVHAPPNCNLE